MASYLARFKKFVVHHKILAGVFTLFVLGFATGLMFLGGSAPEQQVVAVTRGTVVETVSVTGSTVPVKSVSLGFGNTGTVSRVYAGIGKQVVAGQILAELNTNDLYAQVRQAQAALATQQAKLAGLQSGSRPEDIESSRVAVEKAKQDLVNMYSGVIDTSFDAHAKANDAVRTQLDGFFSNPNSINPKLTYLTSNPQAQVDAEAQRFAVTGALDAWQAEVLLESRTSSESDAFIEQEIKYLSLVRQLLSSISKTLDGAVDFNATTLATYKANVAAAIAEVNTASKNLSTAAQNVASQKLAITQLEAQLALKLSGSTPEDLKAQEAQVTSAEASLQSARAKLSNSQLVSPISGIITKFDPKVGQLASSGSELVSVISGTNFEIEAGIPEIDIGKLAIGNRVSITLDAFPGQPFEGHVFYINPAETESDGVVDYEIKIAFDKVDPRMKSGLTANLDIVTRTSEDVLILPQYAILQNDEGSFVQKEIGGEIKEVPVTLGLQDQNGNVEIKSGLEEGDEVLSLGLK